MTDHKFSTEQEAFWAGQFGTEYIERNQGDAALASNLNFFTHALRRASYFGSCMEFGANIGINLEALGLLFPSIKLRGVEINKDAVKHLNEVIGSENVINDSIFNCSDVAPVDLALIKGVLIHIAPEKLKDAYDVLYKASKRYILVCEYYNPVPVSIDYRGHKDRLFKRDFAGEMMDIYPNLKLVDYGFSYHRDPLFPQDDITWFLMEKHHQ